MKIKIVKNLGGDCGSGFGFNLRIMILSKTIPIMKCISAICFEF